MGLGFMDKKGLGGIFREVRMKTFGRILGIAGLVLVITSITSIFLARHYRLEYLREREMRQESADREEEKRREIISAAAGHFLLAAQEHLHKASVAVGRGNFDLAHEEVYEARRTIETLDRMFFSGEIEGISGLRPKFSELETMVSRREEESRVRILEIINTLDQARISLSR